MRKSQKIAVNKMPRESLIAVSLWKKKNTD